MRSMPVLRPGMALAVVQSDFVNFAGVAPILVVLADKRGGRGASAGSAGGPRRPRSSSSSGNMADTSRSASCALSFRRRPTRGLRRSAVRHHVVRRHRRGCDPVRRQGLRHVPADGGNDRCERRGLPTLEFERARLPAGGSPPRVGSVFRQPDLARTISYMADCETAEVHKGRDAGLLAARNAFYRGDIARAIVTYHEQNGGFLSMQDLDEFSVDLERPTANDLSWDHHPQLRLLVPRPRPAADTQHGRTTRDRRARAQFRRVCPRACGDHQARVRRSRRVLRGPAVRCRSGRTTAVEGLRARALGGCKSNDGVSRYAAGRKTGYVSGRRRADGPCARYIVCCGGGPARQRILGNAERRFKQYAGHSGYRPLPVFARQPVLGRAGPSGDGGCRPPTTADTQSGNRRPSRLVRDAFRFAGWRCSGPGHASDFPQHRADRHELQQAVETPRFASFSFPSSFEPHTIEPDRLMVEDAVPSGVVEALRKRGHDVRRWGERNWRAGGVCVVKHDVETGVYAAGADPRRPSYAVGW